MIIVFLLENEYNRDQADWIRKLIIFEIDFLYRASNPKKQSLSNERREGWLGLSPEPNPNPNPKIPKASPCLVLWRQQPAPFLEGQGLQLGLRASGSGFGGAGIGGWKPAIMKAFG